MKIVKCFVLKLRKQIVNTKKYQNRVGAYIIEVFTLYREEFNDFIYFLIHKIFLVSFLL
jgi:hypothetical protein